MVGTRGVDGGRANSGQSPESARSIGISRESRFIDCDVGMRPRAGECSLRVDVCHGVPPPTFTRNYVSRPTFVGSPFKLIEEKRNVAP
jgi:hypothetical protein